VPVVGSSWWIEIEGARQESKLTGFNNTYTPNSGYTFLILDAAFRNLDPIQQTKLSSEAFAVIGEDGEINVAKGMSFGDMEIYLLGNITISNEGDELSNSVVFVVKEDAIDQVFKLQFQEMPPISFSVGQEATYPLTTEIGDKPGALPAVCEVESLHPLGDGGQLTFQRWEGTGRVLAVIAPDGSDAMEVCAGVALGDLQLAADGAALLSLYPQQGWPSLYLIEPGEKVYALVKNGRQIEARFDPSGRWALFTTHRLGETGAGLYVFDRETTSTTLIKEGAEVAFRFLADGHLLVKQRLTESSSPQYFLGQADGSTLELLDISADILASEQVEFSGDGRRIAYIERDESKDWHLFVADVDGGSAQELAKTERWGLQGVLSPDGQFILIGVAEDSTGNRAELRNLTIDKSWTIVTGSDRLEFGFSADGQWAFALSTVRASKEEDEDQHILYVVHTADGSIREIADVVNAFFSPDSTQLAYTVLQADGSLEMYVTPLDDEAPQSLGPGILSGWFPLGTTP
jgi:hypothetical protein